MVDYLNLNKDEKLPYYIKNKEVIYAKQIARNQTKEGRAKNMYYNIKSRAKREGIEFNLDIEDIVIPDICPILQVPFDLSLQQGMKRYGPSLDRIDSNKGYLKDNVQVVSRFANTMKNNSTIEEQRKFAKWVINTYGLPESNKG